MIFNAYSEQREQAMGVTFKSVGHVFAKEGRTIDRPHGREDWLLLYIVDGCELFFLDREIKAEAGSFLIFAPGETQKHCCFSKTAEFYYVHFTADDNWKISDIQTSTVYHGKPSQTICRLFEDILEETLQKMPLFEKVCLHMFFQIVALLERSVVRTEHPTGAHLDAVAFAVQQMNRNFQSNTTLEQYAAMCHMSKFHFLRVFESVTGHSPLAYRNRIRLEHAKEMLEDSSLSIQEIAAKVGFSSTAHFSDSFKKKWGCSPSQYRQNQKKEPKDV